MIGRTLVQGSAVVVAAGSMLAGASGVFAQEAAAPEVNSGNISLDLGVDITTHYFFRGILQEDQGLIFQPYGTVNVALWEGDDMVKTVGVYVGTWSSFHSGPTGTDVNGNAWYEADIYGGVTAELEGGFTAGLGYTYYDSPNDSFESIQEISVSVGYDDTGLIMEDFALSPYALIAFEIDNAADGGDEGIYLEVGIAPAIEVLKSEDYPVTLSFPIAVGMSIDDYYEDGNGDDDFFGFASFGVKASVPLSFIPAEFGAWEASAGVSLLVLGDNMEEVNNGDDLEVIGKVGISMSY